MALTATVNDAFGTRLSRSHDNWGKQRFTSGADDTANTLWAQNAEARGYIGEEQVAALGLINLNARMYDPKLGRFLSVDPIVASIYSLQALNSYSYGLNSPLTFSDPSGLCFITCPFRAVGEAFKTVTSPFASFYNHNRDVLRPVIAIAAAVVLQQYALPFVEASIGLSASTALTAANVAISGAVAGAIGTGTLRGAIIGAATAEAFWGVGSFQTDIANNLAKYGFSPEEAASGAFDAEIALHAAVGCVSSAAGGGQCGNGALSAGLGEITNGYANSIGANPFVKVAIAGLGGGTGAALTGGKFGEGFLIAAEGVIFNCFNHPGECTSSDVEPGLGHPPSPFDFLAGNVVGGIRALVQSGVEELVALEAPAVGTIQAWSGTITAGAVPQGGLTAFRVWGGESAEAGSWLSPIAPASGSAARSLLALPPRQHGKIYFTGPNTGWNANTIWYRCGSFWPSGWWDSDLVAPTHSFI